MTERRDTRRRFEQWARNPDCLANTISAVRGISMADVARSEGLEPSMGQSPFAIARGHGFERTLFENQAERLRKALIEAGLITERDTGFIDLRLRMNGGTCADLDTALDETRKLLARMASARGPASRSHLPTIVAGATIRIPGNVMIPEAILVVDVVLFRIIDNTRQIMVGEIKTYPDRGGYTDGAELATARAQLGVYLHGFETTLSEQALVEKVSLALEGFLVLTRPGYNRPSVRAGEDLRYQLERARRGIAKLHAVAATTVSGSDGIEEVRAAACAYSEGCLSFCDRAPSCYNRALEAGDPVVLGEDAARFMGSIKLDRAGALLAGARPACQAEEDLSRRLRDLSDATRVA